MLIKNSVSVVSLAVIAALGCSSVVHAHTPTSTGSQVTQNSDTDMVARVKQALNSDPSLSDRHIEVSMENGKVVMRGFVNSAGDLTRAVKAANKAAGAKNVVNNLKIKTHDVTQQDATSG
ncbi:MAG TPA: BON domain-containing protein [Steroidobacteraceae bacterium]|jgi:osmotically-inducible protein OsmY